MAWMRMKIICYFEIRIQVDEITKDVSLMVTDFAEEDEVEESKCFGTIKFLVLSKY